MTTTGEDSEASAEPPPAAAILEQIAEAVGRVRRQAAFMHAHIAAGVWVTEDLCAIGAAVPDAESRAA